MSILFVVYLFVVSILDIARKHISMGLLVAGGFLGIMACFFRIYGRNESWVILMAGVLPGLIFLLLSFLSNMVGYGDGIVVCVLGVLVGLRRCMALMGISLLLVAICGIVLLILKKASKDTKIPYIPFLFVTFILLGGM